MRMVNGDGDDDGDDNDDGDGGDDNDDDDDGSSSPYLWLAVLRAPGVTLQWWRDCQAVIAPWLDSVRRWWGPAIVLDNGIFLQILNFPPPPRSSYDHMVITRSSSPLKS